MAQDEEEEEEDDDEGKEERLISAWAQEENYRDGSSLYPMYFGLSSSFLSLHLLSSADESVVDGKRRRRLAEMLLRGSASLLGLIFWRAQKAAEKMAAELRRAESEIARLKILRSEDAKANEKVMGMLADREHRWISSKRKLKLQIKALMNQFRVLEVDKSMKMSAMEEEREMMMKVIEEREMKIAEMVEEGKRMIGEREEEKRRMMGEVEEREMRLVEERRKMMADVEEREMRMDEERKRMMAEMEEEKRKTVGELEEREMRMDAERKKMMAEVDEREMKLGEERTRMMAEMEEREMNMYEERKKMTTEIEEERKKMTEEMEIEIKKVKEFEEREMKKKEERKKMVTEIEEEREMKKAEERKKMIIEIEEEREMKKAEERKKMTIEIEEEKEMKKEGLNMERRRRFPRRTLVDYLQVESKMEEHDEHRDSKIEAFDHLLHKKDRKLKAYKRRLIKMEMELNNLNRDFSHFREEHRAMKNQLSRLHQSPSFSSSKMTRIIKDPDFDQTDRSHSTRVDHKIKRLKQELLTLERVDSSTDLLPALTLLMKQVKKYQTLQESISDLCRRLVQGERQAMEDFLREACFLQRDVVSAGQKVAETQSWVSANLAVAGGGRRKAAMEFSLARFAAMVRILFREVHAGIECRIAGIIGKLEELLA